MSRQIVCPSWCATDHTRDRETTEAYHHDSEPILVEVGDGIEIDRLVAEVKAAQFVPDQIEGPQADWRPWVEVRWPHYDSQTSTFHPSDARRLAIAVLQAAELIDGNGVVSS